jgi:hypothetical protein
MESPSYQKPSVTDLGSLKDLTEQTFNKVGTTPDLFTQITNGIVIGSLVNSP